MLGYYPNSSAKLRGSNLNEKANAYFINIYVGLYISIQANLQININIHKHKNTHSHIYTPTNK